MSDRPALLVPPAQLKAGYAVAALAFSVAAIVVLDRIGAPTPLVLALGPLLALGGAAAIGLLAGAGDLADYLVARRRARPLFAGLAQSAIFAGVVVAAVGAAPGENAPPWRGAAIGLVLSTLAVAPFWRKWQASSAADLLAAAYPARATRNAFALVQALSGWLLAAAGVAFAALTLQASLGLPFSLGVDLAAVSLALSLAPSGLRGLLWCDAAGSGVGLLVVAAFLARAFLRGGESVERATMAEAWTRAAPGASLVDEAAAALAIASLFALAVPSLGTRSAGEARWAGVTALATLAAGAAAAAAVGLTAAGRPAVSALVGFVVCAPAMALARAALFAAARPYGLDASAAHVDLRLLGGRRTAQVRVGVLFGAFAAAVLARIAGPHPGVSLYAGLAVWLAFAAPSLTLAALSEHRSVTAGAALAAAALASLLAWPFAEPSFGPGLLSFALGAAIAGLGAGMGVRSLLGPTTAGPTPRDPFEEDPATA